MDDTAIGGPGSAFPATRRSVILAARSGDGAERDRALGAIVEAYWKPVYKYLRLRWGQSNEDAKDLTQAFFARAIEKGFFDRFDAARARFRTFLRACLDAFVMNERQAAARLKRGGAAAHLPLDFDGAEREIARISRDPAASMEQVFDREWVRSLFGMAVEKLRDRLDRAGRGLQFALFERHDLAEGDGRERPSYAELAVRFSISVTQVTNNLAAARRDFRRIVLDEIRALTGSDEEFRAEARALLGIEPGKRR